MEIIARMEQNEAKTEIMLNAMLALSEALTELKPIEPEEPPDPEEGQEVP